MCMCVCVESTHPHTVDETEYTDFAKRTIAVGIL